MDGLVERGHEILVLSTKAEHSENAQEANQSYQVERVLHDHIGIKRFLRELYFDILDVNLLRRYIHEFKPDLIYLGHIYPMTKQLMPLLSALAIKTLFDEGGNGLKGAWTDHGRWFRLLSDFRFKSRSINALLPIIKRVVLWINRGKLIDTWTWPEKMFIVFNSKLNLTNAQQFGVPVQDSQVVHSGVDSDKFTYKPKSNFSSPLHIIIPGRIEPKKGQIDGVRLLNILEKNDIDGELTLIGPCSDTDYLDKLKEEIFFLSLQGKVIFQEMISQENMVEQYHQSNICFFSSHHHSGFSRVPIEAMACGCLVITYGNEGSNEIIRDKENGFVVEAGNLPEILGLFQQIVSNQDTVEKIIRAARDEIENYYLMPKYVDKIESLLKWVISEA